MGGWAGSLQALYRRSCINTQHWLHLQIHSNLSYSMLTLPMTHTTLLKQYPGLLNNAHWSTSVSVQWWLTSSQLQHNNNTLIHCVSVCVVWCISCCNITYQFINHVDSEERTLGVFWLNTAETWIDISSNTADRVSHSVVNRNTKSTQRLQTYAQVNLESGSTSSWLSEFSGDILVQRTSVIQNFHEHPISFYRAISQIEENVPYLTMLKNPFKKSYVRIQRPVTSNIEAVLPVVKFSRRSNQ